MSLSSRRAWIEIEIALFMRAWSVRRSPHGERGLKSGHITQRSPCKLVALLTESVDWNAVFVEFAKKCAASLSSRRAWIEMAWLMRTQLRRKRRSPHGERGLKFSLTLCHAGSLKSLSSRRAWIEIHTLSFFYLLLLVALLTESVDWNRM